MMQDESHSGAALTRQEGLAAGLFFCLLVFLMPGLRGFPQDNEFWIKWADYSRGQGLRNAYGSGTDYLPVYQYVLWAFGKWAGSPEAIAARLPYLRIVTLAFDCWGLYLLCAWIKVRTGFLTILLIALGNVAYSYNTLIWGQVDGIWTALVFAACYLAWKERLLWSALCMTLALCTKLQAVVLLPVWAILAADAVFRIPLRMRLLKIAAAAGAACLALACLLLPFAFGKGGLQPLLQIVQLASKRFPVLTLSADNLWSWMPQDGGQIADTAPAIFGISYKWTGLILFFGCSLLAMLPLLRHFIRNVRRPVAARTRPDRESLWLCAALVCLAFFYFSTQMHERYAHPAGIFLAAYAFHTRRWGPWLLFSIAYFLNLEVIVRWLALPNYGTLIFHPRFISALYAATIIWLAALLFRRAGVLTRGPVSDYDGLNKASAAV